MKKRVFLAASLSMLLISMLTGLQPSNSASGQYSSIAEPPIITILYPENKTYATNNIFLSFNVSIGQLNETLELVDLTEVYYIGDWQQNNTYILHNAIAKTIVFSTNLTEVPEGIHSIMVVAKERIPDPSLPPYLFYFSPSSLSINFTVDTSAPSVSILSPEFMVYETSDVTLDFTVNESCTQIAYSLDGEDNMTVAGNTTLSGLSSGEHNVTVYAWDTAGNVGASETVTFTVTDVLQAVLIIAVILTVIVFSIGLLLFYFKKRKQ